MVFIQVQIVHQLFLVCTFFTHTLTCLRQDQFFLLLEIDLFCVFANFF